MPEYVCNDCCDGDEFVGTCRLSLPDIAGKPKYCPVCDGVEECEWVEVKTTTKPEDRELHHYWGEGWVDGYGCGYKDGVLNTRIGIGVCGLVMLAVWLLIRVWF